MPRGEEVVRAETHTQKVWPTITENGDVKPLCAYHSDVETKNNTYANHLAGEMGWEGNDVGKTQEEPQEGRCAHCDLAIKNPGKHLDMILRPWQRGDRDAESGPTVPPSPTGIPRLDRARQRKRDDWTSKTKPVEPMIHSLNALDRTAVQGIDYSERAADLDMPEEIHRGLALRLPPDVHDAVRDESRPVAERAQMISDHLNEPWIGNKGKPRGLGSHWTTNPGTAEGYSKKHKSWPEASPYDFEPDPKYTRVVLHAGPPKPSHLLSSERTLRDRDIFGYEHSEKEIPFRRNAPVTLKGISFGPNERGGELTRHDFEQPLKFKATLTDDDEDAYSRTDWDKHYPTFHEVHRGMAVHLPPDLHERAHGSLDDLDPDSEEYDEAESSGRYDRDQVAHDIVKHLSKQPVGQHWTADRSVAGRFAEDGVHASHLRNEHGTPATMVVLTAHKPAREDIETDPEKLEHDYGDEPVQSFDAGADRNIAEREVPVKAGTKMHIKGIEWAHQGRHMHDGHGDHGSDIGENVEPYTGPLHVHATNSYSIRRTAHDSGDNQRIFHCPFCGSGRVIAGSDGTTDCGFCNQSFTVQVQPRYPSFPQTVNGQPVQIPGMPGQPDMAPPGTFGPGANPPDDPDASGGFPGGDEDGGGDDLASPDDEPPFLKNTSLYRTAAGDALPEDKYLRHLALAVAYDHSTVLRHVRASRK